MVPMSLQWQIAHINAIILFTWIRKGILFISLVPMELSIHSVGRPKTDLWIELWARFIVQWNHEMGFI